MSSFIPMAPCKGCSDRHPACHDSCEKYQSWKHARDTRIEELNREKSIDRYVGNMKNRRLSDIIKHRARRGKRWDVLK